MSAPLSMSEHHQVLALIYEDIYISYDLRLWLRRAYSDGDVDEVREILAMSARMVASVSSKTLALAN